MREKEKKGERGEGFEETINLKKLRVEVSETRKRGGGE